MATAYYAMIGDKVLESFDVPTQGQFDWTKLKAYIKTAYGESCHLVDEYSLDAMFEDYEDDYYDPCDHCCECDSENGCVECNPDELPVHV